MTTLRCLLLAALGLSLTAGASPAEEIGSVSTVWKFLGPNHKIVVEAFDDPDIPNVSCWVSRPRTGGMSGAVGLAEDPSYGSIACRQRGPIVLSDNLRDQLEEETEDGGVKVFKARTSAIFKTIQVTRMFDSNRNTVLYLIWSDRVVEGSPKNSISVVVIQPWDPDS
ncbi:MAG: CreA family protein [Rhodospirillales bacterium]|nr:CreA family protein [Rhodospirillales bacterium]